MRLEGVVAAGRIGTVIVLDHHNKVAGTAVIEGGIQRDGNPVVGTAVVVVAGAAIDLGQRVVGNPCGQGG